MKDVTYGDTKKGLSGKHTKGRHSASQLERERDKSTAMVLNKDNTTAYFEVLKI